MWHFEQIAEQRIRQAMARGDFDELEGKDRPLPPEDELEQVPPELRLAYRVLKNAGFVPEDVALRKEIARLEALLRAVDGGGIEEQGIEGRGPEDQARYAQAVKRLNLLRARLGARHGREPGLHLEAGYYHKALRRLSGSG